MRERGLRGAQRGQRGAQSEQRHVCACWGGQLRVHVLSGLRDDRQKRPPAQLIVWGCWALQELRNDVTSIH